MPRGVGLLGPAVRVVLYAHSISNRIKRYFYSQSKRKVATHRRRCEAKNVLF